MSSSSDAACLFTEEYNEKLANMKAAMNISDIAVYEAMNDFNAHVAAYVEKKLAEKKATEGAN
jgi:Xaa-Pro aminopeptidase